MAGRDIGTDGLSRLSRARYFSHGIGDLALAARGADGDITDRREKKTVPRCIPAPASSRGVHPESSPPEASIGGVSNKKARRSSCVATEANGLRAALASLPTSSHRSIHSGDEEPRAHQLASLLRIFERGADEQSRRGSKLSASRSANRSGDRAPLRYASSIISSKKSIFARVLSSTQASNCARSTSSNEKAGSLDSLVTAGLSRYRVSAATSRCLPDRASAPRLPSSRSDDRCSRRVRSFRRGPCARHRAAGGRKRSAHR